MEYMHVKMFILTILLSILVLSGCATKTDRSLATLKAFLGQEIEGHKGPATIVHNDHRVQFSTEMLEEFFQCLCDKDNKQCNFYTFTIDTRALNFPVEQIKKVPKDDRDQSTQRSDNVKFVCARTGHANLEEVQCSLDSQAPEIGLSPSLADLDTTVGRVCDYRCIELSFPSVVAFENFGRGPYQNDLFCIQPYRQVDNQDVRNGGNVDVQLKDNKDSDSRDGSNSGEDGDSDNQREETVRLSGLSDNRSNTVFILVVVLLTVSLLINVAVCLLWSSRWWKKRPQVVRRLSIHVEMKEPIGGVENAIYTGDQTTDRELGTSGDAESYLESGRGEGDLARPLEMNAYNIPENEYASPSEISLAIEQNCTSASFDTFYVSPKSVAELKPFKKHQDSGLCPFSFTPEKKDLSSDDSPQRGCGAYAVADDGDHYSVPMSESARAENLYTDIFSLRDQARP